MGSCRGLLKISSRIVAVENDRWHPARTSLEKNTRYNKEMESLSEWNAFPALNQDH